MSRDRLGYEILRLGWLRGNVKFIRVNHDKSSGHYLHYRRGSTEIYADTILRIVDAALEED